MEASQLIASKPPDLSLSLSHMECVAGGGLRICVETVPWWRGDLGGSSCQLEFLLNGVKESSFDFGSASEIKRLEFCRESPLLWDYAGTSSIFGNAPLPDPPRFFFEFYQLVKFGMRIDRDPVKYLNWEKDFAQWQHFVFSRSYCLLSAPDPVVEASRPLLDVQAADYTVLADPPREGIAELASELQVLLFDSSWVIFRGIEASDVGDYVVVA